MATARELEIPGGYLDVLRSAKVSMSALTAYLRRKGVLSSRPTRFRLGRAVHRLFGSTAYPITKRELVSCIEERDTVLEIGPFTNPLIRGKNVRYFDVLDKEGLIIRAAEHNYNAESPVDIHYVSSNGDLGIVEATFDFVVSSHCIEHQPDFIRHLQGVERLLNPNGRYLLVIPDKRYCFDRFMPLSTIDDIMAAYTDNRTLHTLESHRLHATLSTHNDSRRHWSGDHGVPAGDENFSLDDERKLILDIGQGRYSDVHAWYFTPSNFAAIVNSLVELKMSNLRVLSVHSTARNNLEFSAVLQKK